MVERVLWEHEVAGSRPVIPIIHIKYIGWHGGMVYATDLKSVGH